MIEEYEEDEDMHYQQKVLNYALSPENAWKPRVDSEPIDKLYR